MGLRALVAFILILVLTSPALGQRGRRVQRNFSQAVPLYLRGPDGGWMLRFNNTPMAKVLDDIARLTQERFLYDSQPQGSITIQVPEPVDEKEALQILNAALLMHGYMMVVGPEGVRKIVPIDDFAAQAPLLEGEPRDDGEELVTTFVRLEHADPDEISSTIRDMVGNSGLIVPYPETQSLIVTATERRLHRLLSIIAELDRAGEVDLVVLSLRHRDATEVADMLSEALPQRVQVDFERVTPSPATNSLIVQATPRRIVEIRSFLAEIDRAPEGEGELHVVPVLHADPERLQASLESLKVTDGGDAPAQRQNQSELANRDFSVVVHKPTRSLVVSADPATFEIVSEVIAKLDREEPRVSIELVLFEVQIEKGFALGIDYIVPLTGSRAPDDLLAAISVENTSADLLATAAGLPQEGVVSRFVGSTVLIPITDAAGNVITTLGLPAAQLVARESVAEISVLQRPHLLMISGEDQEIAVGNNIPIPVSAQANDANPLQVQQSIERHDVGISMRVGTTVGQRGPVRVEIALEQSAVSAPVAGDVDVVGPTLRTRTLQGTVYLENGETAVIGGLASVRKLSGTSKVPYLGDIPGLRALFSATEERETDVHLMLAVSARVLRTRAQDQLETIRRRTAFERSLADLGELREMTRSPYALLVASHSSHGRAQADVSSLADSPYLPQIVEWKSNGRKRFDVYLTGFEEFGEATLESHAIREAGWKPEVVVVDRVMPR